ncbi:MAG: four helix bundle protein [Balneolaceae bacterium]
MKYDLEERLIDYSLLAIKLTENLPKSYTAQHFTKQLIRSGSSPAFQYAEARGAESRKDFVHKLEIGLKELRETHVCLRMINKKPLLIGSNIDDAISECDQLIAIITSSINTAIRNSKQ